MRYSCLPGWFSGDSLSKTPCQPCETGTFSLEAQGVCTPWSQCSYGNSFARILPTASSDRVCTWPCSFANQPFVYSVTPTCNLAGVEAVNVTGVNFLLPVIPTLNFSFVPSYLTCQWWISTCSMNGTLNSYTRSLFSHTVGKSMVISVVVIWEGAFYESR